MNALLAQTRTSFGAAPRRFPVSDNVMPPSWMKKDDPLRATYKAMRDILENGDVVWGFIVQANDLLFRPGDHDHPATVLFASRPDDDLDLDLLESAAARAFAFKGKPMADAALAHLAKSLAEETKREPMFDLPNAVTYGVPMRMATVMIHRAILPSRYLVSSALPLVATRARDAVMLLPARHWAPDLARGWVDLAARAH